MNKKFISKRLKLSISHNICPQCGWYLTKRINGKTGEQFRGCSNFPYNNCTFTISDKEYINIYKDSLK